MNFLRPNYSLVTQLRSSFVLYTNIQKVVNIKPPTTAFCYGGSVKFSSRPPSSKDDAELDDFLSQINEDFQSENEPSSKISNIKHDHQILDDLADAWSQISRTSYENFDLSKSRIIYDAIEEELGLKEAEEDLIKPEPVNVINPIELKRGKTGVLDLDQLINILKDEKAKNIVAFKMPQDALYVDHMVIVSAKSQRHLDAVAMSVRKYYLKLKRRKDKPIVLEGKGTKWIATDLGNIVLHVMSPTMREKMDIESLWICGPEHDPKTHEIQDADLYSAFQFDLDDPNFVLDDIDISHESSDTLNLNEGSKTENNLITNDNIESDEIDPQDLTTEIVYNNYMKSVDERL